MKPRRWMITAVIKIFFVLTIPLYLCGCTSSDLKGRVLDENGKPIVNAYVVYGYVGVESKIVEWDEYHRP